MEVLVWASSSVPILKHLQEIVIMQRMEVMDALYQYYGIYLWALDKR